MLTQFASDTKEALFRVLKETVKAEQNLDLCLYTRGGDTNAVWPTVSLLREFDPDFSVLVPFRCHSAGTLLALGSKQIVMTQLSELSPIDPSTGNQFNPVDPNNKQNRLAISIEDVQQYRRFVLNQLKGGDDDHAGSTDSALLAPFLDQLARRVHPLALGNVHRVHQQIKQLAKNLLDLHPAADRDVGLVVESFTTTFYSHLHMVNRHEAREILGGNQVEFAGQQLAELLDLLLRSYEDDFALRKPFLIGASLKDELTKDVRFIGGAVESKAWSYLFETCATVRQRSVLPANVQVQLPPGQPMPLIPGLPRQYDVEVTSQGWARNTDPKGVTK